MKNAASLVRHVVLGAAGIVASASTIACVAPSGEDVGRDESAMMCMDCDTTTGGGGGGSTSGGTFYPEPLPSEEVAAGFCPAGNMTGIDAQRRVTAAWKYILGGDRHPNVDYPCADGTTLPLEALRNFLAIDKCKVSNPTPASVCSTTANVYTLSCTGLATRDDAIAVVHVAKAMDTCWGVGPSGFFNVENGTFGMYVVRYRESWRVNMKLDPEPARVRSMLDSTTMSAPAYYVNSYVDTTVIKWGTSYVPGTAAAGTPCSPSDLYPGQDALRTIQAYGSYRRCI